MAKRKLVRYSVGNSVAGLIGTRTTIREATLLAMKYFGQVSETVAIFDRQAEFGEIDLWSYNRAGLKPIRRKSGDDCDKPGFDR